MKSLSDSQRHSPKIELPRSGWHFEASEQCVALFYAKLKKEQYCSTEYYSRVRNYIHSKHTFDNKPQSLSSQEVVQNRRRICPKMNARQNRMNKINLSGCSSKCEGFYTLDQVQRTLSTARQPEDQSKQMEHLHSANVRDKIKVDFKNKLTQFRCPVTAPDDHEVISYKKQKSEKSGVNASGRK